MLAIAYMRPSSDLQHFEFMRGHRSTSDFSNQSYYIRCWSAQPRVALRKCNRPTPHRRGMSPSRLSHPLPFYHPLATIRLNLKSNVIQSATKINHKWLLYYSAFSSLALLWYELRERIGRRGWQANLVCSLIVNKMSSNKSQNGRDEWQPSLAPVYGLIGSSLSNRPLCHPLSPFINRAAIQPIGSTF